MPPLPSSSRSRIALALGAVYLIWGSTYLGVRVALTSFPPVLLVGIRYSVAGALLYGWLRVRGVPAPARRYWGMAGLIGALLVGGSAATAYALRDVPTGVTAIACGSVPLWSIILARWWGEKTSGREWIGLILGLAGVLLLNAKSELRAHAAAAIVLWIGSMAWAFGSTLGRYAKMPDGAMASALQMMLGGFAVLAAGLVIGERVTAMPRPAAIVAYVYLISIGSIVGYSAYVYVLPRVRTSLAMSYAYVNPIVAVALGVMFDGESIGRGTLAASSLILGGVALLASNPKSDAHPRRPPESRHALDASDVGPSQIAASPLREGHPRSGTDAAPS